MTRGGVTARRQGTDLRGSILDAARQILVQGGHEAVSMRGIAERIGYSATAIYHHFCSREDLLRAVCSRDLRGLSAAFFLHIATVEDPVERLRRMGRSFLDFALRHPSQYVFLFMTARSETSSGCEHGESDPVDDAYLFLFSTVGEAAAQGRFREELGDPERVAQLLWSSLHGLASLHIAKPHRDWLGGGSIVSLSGTAIEVVLRGVLR